MITYIGDAIKEYTQLPPEMERFDTDTIESVHWLDNDEHPDDDMICVVGGRGCSCHTGRLTLFERWFGKKKCEWYVKL
jgi:hypothetical protein